MTKLIMIRGCSGSGKTTLMKSFIQHHGMGLRDLNGIAFMQSGGYIVLGDYTKDGCVGCDRYRNIADIKAHLALLRDAYAPDFLLFEHMLLSTTYKYTKELVAIFGKQNFGAIFLDNKFNDILRNISKRNAQKNIKQENVYKNFLRARNAFLKLAFSGVYTLRVDPFCYTPASTYAIIDNFIASWNGVNSSGV